MIVSVFGTISPASRLLPVGLGLYENAYIDGLPFRNPMLTKAIAYIRANLFTIRSISEISDSLFITESYLFEIFKKALHISPKKFTPPNVF